MKNILLITFLISIIYCNYYSESFGTPDRWEKIRESNGDEKMTISIQLHTQNIDDLERIAKLVSDPDSIHYGQYLSIEEITKIVAPPKFHQDIVMNWVTSLLANEADSIEFHSNFDSISVVCSVRGIRNLFETSPTFNFYQNIRTGRVILKTTDTLTIDEKVAPYVFDIANVNDFIELKHSAQERKIAMENMKKNAQKLNTDSAPVIESMIPFSGFLQIGVLGTILKPYDSYIFRWQLDQLGNQSIDIVLPFTSKYYSVPVPNYQIGYISVAYYDSKNKTAGTFGPVRNQPILPHDMATPDFLRNFYGVPSGYFGNGLNSLSNNSVYEPFNSLNASEVAQWQTYNGVIGGVNLLGELNEQAGDTQGEAALDIEAITGMAQNFSAYFYNQKTDNLPLWIENIAGDATAALVHSTSWYAEEDSFSKKEGLKVTASLLKLAARGITMLSATGDDGAYGAPLCGNGKVATQFPGANPWILSVGATRPAVSKTSPLCSELYSQQTDEYTPPIVCAGTGEVGVSIANGAVFTSAGAFSKRYKRPWYQDSFVSNYLNQTQKSLPKNSSYNATNRGFNDVTAIGSDYFILSDGVYMWSGGTSASSPLVAGLLTIANDVLIRNNKPPLGFVNPLLYKLKTTHPEIFNVINAGANGCAGWYTTLEDCCPEGFPVETEWSPPVGLGSINFGNFKAYLENEH